MSWQDDPKHPSQSLIVANLTFDQCELIRHNVSYSGAAIGSRTAYGKHAPYIASFYGARGKILELLKWRPEDTTLEHDGGQWVMKHK